MNKIIPILCLSLFFSFTLFAQSQIGGDIDGEASGDNCGSGLALSSDGSRVIIGAWYNDGVIFNGGHARIFEESEGEWVQVGGDIDGEGFSDNLGGAVSINGDGSRVIVGANNNDGNGSFSGQAQVYEESSGVWTQVGADLYGAPYDQAGSSVAMDETGTRIAIGLPGYDNGTVYQVGQVKIYEEVAGTWNLIGAITGEAGNDISGTAIALSSDGSTVAIGAIFNNGNGTEAGHVRVYEESGGSWTQVGSDIDGEAAGDRSGYSVALNSDGSVVAIGAYLNDGNGTDGGHVRVYEESGGSWTQIGDDINSEGADEFFGTSVDLDMSGTKLVVGAAKNDGNGTDAGHVRIYEESGGVWTQSGSDIAGEAAEDWFGASVSMDATGDRVAGGANFNDGNGIDAGHVRIYHTSDPLPVELIHFSARSMNSGNILQWLTATEINNSHFEIQHSNSGRDFQTIGTIEGAGNSTLENNYEYLHEKPNEGSNYYRIKQVDFDGQYDYSNVAEVHHKSQTVSFYPNPTTDNLNLSLTKANQVSVYSTLGRVLDRFELEAGEHEIGLKGYGRSLLLLQIGEEWYRVVVE